MTNEEQEATRERGDGMIDLDALKEAVADNRKRFARHRRDDLRRRKAEHNREREEEIASGGDGKWYDEHPVEVDIEDDLAMNLGHSIALALIAVAERMEPSR